MFGKGQKRISSKSSTKGHAPLIAWLKERGHAANDDEAKALFDVLTDMKMLPTPGTIQQRVLSFHLRGLTCLFIGELRDEASSWKASKKGQSVSAGGFLAFSLGIVSLISLCLYSNCRLFLHQQITSSGDGSIYCPRAKWIAHSNILTFSAKSFKNISVFVSEPVL